MAGLELQNVQKTLGGNAILRGINLKAEDGELIVLVGPSGCGKSTLLRCIAGLEIPDAGGIHIGDRDVTRLPPRDRDVAMVFQSYALYPHLTVRDNLTFGLKMRKSAPALMAERVAEVSRMLGLDALLDRLPRQLSGGQRQRVAMGRAIARRPHLFLFDEPLSNLDAALRAEVRVEIKRLHSKLGATMVYVTHDQVEAMTLADKLVILNGGVVEQSGPPLEVYQKPASRFVAAFMGSPSMNFLSANLDAGFLRTDGLRLQSPELLDDQPILAGVRPHDVVPAADPAHPAITMRVDVVEAMGFEAYAHGSVGGQPFIARLEGDAAYRVTPQSTLALDVAPEAIHIFDPVTERSLRTYRTKDSDDGGSTHRSSREPEPQSSSDGAGTHAAGQVSTEIQA